ncbi:hypothetical protein GCM10020255_028720 [Rhodococcus baikonurensis]
MSIVQRVYPTEGAQLDVLVMHCDHARYVYNLGLEQRSWWTPSRRHFRQKINYVSQAADLTEARREYDWLRAGSSVVQQGALRDLDRAFINFFARRAGYPTFKKRSNARQGSWFVIWRCVGSIAAGVRFWCRRPGGCGSVSHAPGPTSAPRHRLGWP